jgi:hypothetical protein
MERASRAYSSPGAQRETVFSLTWSISATWASVQREAASDEQGRVGGSLADLNYGRRGSSCPADDRPAYAGDPHPLRIPAAVQLTALSVFVEEGGEPLE